MIQLRKKGRNTSASSPHFLAVVHMLLSKQFFAGQAELPLSPPAQTQLLKQESRLGEIKGAEAGLRSAAVESSSKRRAPFQKKNTLSNALRRLGLPSPLDSGILTKHSGSKKLKRKALSSFFLSLISYI